jgi:hypothetical protein
MNDKVRSHVRLTPVTPTITHMHTHVGMAAPICTQNTNIPDTYQLPKYQTCPAAAQLAGTVDAREQTGEGHTHTRDT